MRATRSSQARTAFVKLVMHASLAPSAIACTEVLNGSQAA